MGGKNHSRTPSAQLQNKIPDQIQINRIKPYYTTSDATELSSLQTITIESDDNPHLPTGTKVTKTAVSTEVDEDGWFPVKDTIGGGYFKLTYTFAWASGENLKEFLGFWVDFKPRGES